jgi:hypothetical protein
MPETFARVIVLDFEYEVTPGGLPGVLCMVAYELDERLRHVRTFRLWRGEFGPRPPFDIGPDTLVVGYSLWAEMMCFLMLGWSFPVHVYCLHTTHLASTNFLLPKDPEKKRIKPRKGLSDACRASGIDGWENIDKPAMSKDIGEGLWRKYGQPAVFEYCEEDVRNSAELLRRQLRKGVDVPLVLHWSEYSAKVVARIQAKGMPVDVPLWHLVQENKTTIVRELVHLYASSPLPIFRSDPTDAIDQAYSHLERRPDEMRIAAVCSTSTPQCAASCNSRQTPLGCIW